MPYSEEILKIMPFEKLITLGSAGLTKIQKTLLRRLHEAADADDEKAIQLVERTRKALVDVVFWHDITIDDVNLSPAQITESKEIASSHRDNSLRLAANHLRGQIGVAAVTDP